MQQTLLDSGAQLDRADRDGATALHYIIQGDAAGLHRHGQHFTCGQDTHAKAYAFTCRTIHE